MCAGVFYEELLMIATVVFYNKIGEKIKVKIPAVSLNEGRDGCSGRNRLANPNQRNIFESSHITRFGCLMFIHSRFKRKDKFNIFHGIASARRSRPSTQMLATIAIPTGAQPIASPKLTCGWLWLCRGVR